MSTDAPLVSICCITYNHSDYIGDAISSFLNQKCNFAIEIIIHDDASTDGTTEILKEYDSQAHPGLSIIFQTENQYSKGSRPLLSFVLPQVRGKYIALCEGDDNWTDNSKLDKQVTFLENNPEFGLIASDVSVIGIADEDLARQIHVNRSSKSGEVTFYDLLETNHINTPTVCIRSEIMLRLASEAVEQGKWYAIDKWFWLSTALEARIFITADITANYRWHTEGLSKTVNFFIERKPLILGDVLLKFLTGSRPSNNSRQTVIIVAGSLSEVFQSSVITLKRKLKLFCNLCKHPRLLAAVLRIVLAKVIKLRSQEYVIIDNL